MELLDCLGNPAPMQRVLQYLDLIRNCVLQLEVLEANGEDESTILLSSG